MKPKVASLLPTTTPAGLLTLSVAGCHKAPEVAATGAPGTSVGAEIDDSVLTTKVRAALLTEPDVNSFDIKTETRKGEVQLSGFIDSQTQMDRAILLARGIEGVAAVSNEMSLKK